MSIPGVQLCERLWISGMPNPGWDAENSGVDIIVSVADHTCPQAGRRFEWGTRGDSAGAGRILYIHWPIEDGDLPQASLLGLIVEQISAGIRKGHTVLIHCQEGRNRSGLIAGLVLRNLYHISGREALTHIREKQIGAVSNKTFANYLENLD